MQKLCWKGTVFCKKEFYKPRPQANDVCQQRPLFFFCFEIYRGVFSVCSVCVFAHSPRSESNRTSKSFSDDGISVSVNSMYFKRLLNNRLLYIAVVPPLTALTFAMGRKRTAAEASASTEPVEEKAKVVRQRVSKAKAEEPVAEPPSPKTGTKRVVRIEHCNSW